MNLVTRHNEAVILYYAMVGNKCKKKKNQHKVAYNKQTWQPWMTC